MSAAPPAPHMVPAPPSGWRSNGRSTPPAAPSADARLWVLVDQITKLAPELSPASIMAASAQIASLSPRAVRPSVGLSAALMDEEPPIPRDLLSSMDDEAALAQHAFGSATSIDASADRASHAQEPARYAAGSRMGDNLEPDLFQPGGDRLSLTHLDVVGYDASGPGVGTFHREWAPIFGEEGDGSHGGGGGGGGSSGSSDDDDDDDPAVGDRAVRRQESREPLDLDAGQRLVCDACELSEVGGSDLSCMACDMEHVGEMKDIIKKWTRKLERRGALREFPERRAPRYAMYRALIKWKFADPLGAENRLVLPECVKRSVRRRFPNPRCGEGCDFGVECERNGHYTGHRTAAEARALRGDESVEGQQE